MIKHRFVVDPVACTGCRTCELACSFAHSVDGQLGKSRIYPLTTGVTDLWVPVTCLQCEEAACVKSCLVNALRRNSETGAVELHEEICVNCMACVAACPFGCAIHDNANELIVKCDLCGGDPACAKFCPTKALEYVEVESPAKKKAV